VQERRAIFISHAAPEDNAFTIWLGAKLAAAGYEVWADVLRLNGGDDWQRKLEEALRERACKVLLAANPKAVDKQGVRNEIQIATDVAKKIGDSNFIIPLRLAPFEAPFLIAHAQYIDFSRGWATGLFDLLQVLQEEYKVPTQPSASVEAWTTLQAMHGRPLENRAERLISNWLRIRKVPETIFYYRNSELKQHGVQLSLPKVEYGEGFLTCEENAIENASRTSLEGALENGWPELAISTQDMRNRFTDIANQGMGMLLKTQGLKLHEMANKRVAWWYGNDLSDSRQAFQWGDTKGSRVLRGYSEKRKLHWHFGISAFYRGGPLRHFRIKTRLLFSEDGTTILHAKRMHRVRRSFAKGWRNARWRDMLLSLLYWASGGESLLRIPLHLDDDLLVEVPPIFFTSPVSVSEGEAGEQDSDDPDIEFLDEEVLDEEDE
jgi:hypothetical protein